MLASSFFTLSTIQEAGDASNSTASTVVDNESQEKSSIADSDIKVTGILFNILLSFLCVHALLIELLKILPFTTRIPQQKQVDHIKLVWVASVE